MVFVEGASVPARSASQSASARCRTIQIMQRGRNQRMARLRAFFEKASRDFHVARSSSLSLGITDSWAQGPIFLWDGCNWFWLQSQGSAAPEALGLEPAGPSVLPLSVSAPHDTHSATHAFCQQTWQCCFQEFHTDPLCVLGLLGVDW